MDTKTKILMVSAISIFSYLSIYNTVHANFYDWLVSREEYLSDPLVSISIEENSNSFDKLFAWDNRKVPENKEEDETPEVRVVKTHTVRATAYSSTPDQTDDTPFITASGAHVRDGIIAANFYMDGRRVPFGTLIRIPEIYGEKIFTVEDRMHHRYTNNIDVWFPERNLAKSFGSKKVVIEILEES